MSHYRVATAAPAHLKIVVSFLLSILVAATVAMALRSVLRIDLAIDRHFVLSETHRP